MASSQEREQESGWDRRRVLLLTEYEGVALRLFAARGYAAVTFDEIAAAADVSSRTLFRYFPTKDAFLVGMPGRGLVRLLAELRTLEPSTTPLRTA